MSVTPETAFQTKAGFFPGEVSGRGVRAGTNGLRGERHTLGKPLAAREKEVLAVLCEGATNAQIAERLLLTTGTVKVYLHRIFRKIGCKSRAELIAAEVMRLKAELEQFKQAKENE